MRGRCTACLLFTAFGASAAPAAAQESKTPWVLDAFAGAAKDNVNETGAAPVMPTLQSFSTSLGQRFVGSPADSPYHSEVNAGLDDRDQPWLTSRALLPFAQSNIDTMLFQGNVTHAWTGPGAEPNGGFGLGYRRLFGDSEWLAGANAFVDDAWSGNRSRGSFGGELRTAPAGVTMNYYQPYATADAGGLRPSAAGYDYDLRLQIPYVPSATVSVGGGAWAFEPTLGLMESKRLGVTFNPLPYLAFDGRMDRSADTPAAYSVGLRITLSLDGKPRAPNRGIVDDRAFQSSSVAERARDIIRRDEAIPNGEGGG